MAERVEWIDTAKGVGIILVIAGHTFFIMYSAIIYAFHMPLFFFLSGLVLNTAKYPSCSELIKAKTIQVLRPWLFFYVSSLIVTILIPAWRSALSWRQMLTELYTANTNNINNSSIWYLVCLFATFVILYLIHSLLRHVSEKGTIVFLLFLGGALLWIKEFLALIAPAFHLIQGRLPFKIDTALVAFIFMYIGYRFRDYVFKLIENSSLLKLSIAVLALFAGFAVNRWSNINGLVFGNYRLLYYPIAFLGIYCVLSFCFLISRQREAMCRQLRIVLVFYGVNCLVVFGFQSLLIRLYIWIANDYYGQSMVLYGNNSMIHQVCSFVLVCFVFSPIVVMGMKQLQKQGFKLI